MSWEPKISLIGSGHPKNGLPVSVAEVLSGLFALRLFALRLFALSGTHEQSAATRHSAPLRQSVGDRSGLHGSGLRCAFWCPERCPDLIP